MADPRSFKTKSAKAVFVKIPIYESRLLIIKHDGKRGYNQVINFFREISLPSADDHDNEDGRNCYGYVLQERIKSGMINILVLNTRRDYRSDLINTISHEVTHLVDNISRHHGLQKYKNGHNEHIAYLTGYLVDLIYKA